MSTGKKVAGIIMSVFGGLFLFSAVIFAIVFLAVGRIMGNVRQNAAEEFEEFSKHAVETYGTITDVDSSTTIEYYSEMDDSYYQVAFSVSNSSFREGDSIVIYYDEDNPGSCMAPDLVEGTYETLGTVFYGVGAGAGVFFGIMGLGLLIGGIVLIKKSKSS